MTQNTTTPTRRTLVATRVIRAPRELVFRAWTDPELFTCWWGPNGFTTPFCKIDPRPGSYFHYCMRSPEGRDYWGKGTYREIRKPERIVFTDTFADEAGNPVSPTTYGLSPDWPAETKVTVTFVEKGGQTELTLESPGIPPGRDADVAQAGWSQSLERLAGCLEKS
jgi:uncharacterized protein YndB with AHSA1/START domain